MRRLFSGLRSECGAIRLLVTLAVGWAGLLTAAVAIADEPATDVAMADPAAAAQQEQKLLTNVRQVTFGGLRAGEGYFSQDGRRMVFQSERDPANPFYQIFLLDRETGDIQQVSTGTGKTTCAWIHPDGTRVLYASTHHDPQSEKLQQNELGLRAGGTQRRYAWDYDPQYELYEYDLASGQHRQLTDSVGYDAEASYSPDGKSVLFASNRQAFERRLSGRERTLFEHDPASMIDIYRLDLESGDIRRLTDTLGYDGGPFYSPDGQRFCWRRFSEDGASAEIFTMSIDGGEATRLTQLNAMSWAPFYHPSGQYLVFTTNLLGFANFELFLVRADGSGDPVRVTYTDGFDGLPVFLPSGDQLSWTSTRGSGRSQIFLGDWDHAEALRQLGLADPAQTPPSEDRDAALLAAQSTSPEFTPADIGRHVDYLTRPELGGRMTGTEGERRATQYVAAYLESLGFEPAGADGTWYQEFEFPAGAELGTANSLQINDQPLQLGSQWRPLAFSGDGVIEPANVVFAGYGLVAPGNERVAEYDSYQGLDVTDQWVVVLRDLPQEIAPELRQHWARYSNPRRKATVARDRGARGIVFVAGPSSRVKQQLIRFDSDASAGVSLAIVSLDDATAEQLFAGHDTDLATAQVALDAGDWKPGFELPAVTIGGQIEIIRKTGVGRNVIGRLRTGPAVAPADDPNPTRERATTVAPADDPNPTRERGTTVAPADNPNPARERGTTVAPADNPNPTRERATTVKQYDKSFVIVGAHIDHLGTGAGTNSLAGESEQGMIHVGADDNASGVAAMLEIAQYLANQHKQGNLPAQRDLVVAGWSGEELGLFGSQAFVKNFFDLFPGSQRIPNPFGDVENDPQARMIMAAHGMSEFDEPLTAAVAAYLNLDMVGRLREKLVIQGIGSSPVWTDLVQQRNVPVGLPLELDKTASRLPTDAAAFVAREVPILAAFTGAHEDYHTPRDTPEKLNYDGAAKTAHLMALIARGLLTDGQAPPFELDEEQQEKEVPRANLTAYLGTIPDYVAGEVKGMRLSGVSPGGPAATAGLQGGDVIVELAGAKIEDVYDYTYAIEALKIGETVKVVLMRGGERRELEITPTARE